MGETVTKEAIERRQAELIVAAQKLAKMTDGERIMKEAEGLKRKAEELEAMALVYEQEHTAPSVNASTTQILKVQLTEQQRKNVHAETGVWLDVVEFEEGVQLQGAGMPYEYPQMVEYQAIQVAKRQKGDEAAKNHAKTTALENIAEIRKNGGKEANAQLDQLLKDPNFLDGLLK